MIISIEHKFIKSADCLLRHSTDERIDEYRQIIITSIIFGDYAIALADNKTLNVPLPITQKNDENSIGKKIGVEYIPYDCSEKNVVSFQVVANLSTF